MLGDGLSWEQNIFQQKSLLEIGSATGFFLDEARQAGFSVAGIEISDEGVKYAKDLLDLSIWKGNFLDYPVGPDTQVDVIASFFTIEHISDIEAVWNKIDSLLKPGGGLLLALPSFNGPSFQTDPKNWFLTHPEDHFYDYDPASLKNVLKQMGYEVKLNKPLSYHPSRDKGWKGKLPKLGYKWISDRICYGDTFQIVAIKK